MTQTIDSLMKQAVEDLVFPSAALLVAHREKILHKGYYGKARKGMCFDIASLTKPICTATLAMLLVQEGKIELTQAVHKKVTIEHLLSHTSGLPSWKPYYRELPLDAIGTEKGERHILRSIMEEPLFAEPGKICEYSDLGYILLGDFLEKAGGKPLEVLFDEKIAKPLKLKNTFFVKQGVPTHGLTVPRRRFAPTEDCPWRRKVIHGEVHDQNCYAMGGVAGHAGLFATTSDVHRFVVALLKCYRGQSDWTKQKIVKEFLDWHISTSTHPHIGTYVLGWDTPTSGSSSAGRYFSPHSIGHLGYTGCSLWIDLNKDFWVILLTNRIHPSTANEKIKTFRPRLHDAVVREFMA